MAVAVTAPWVGNTIIIAGSNNVPNPNPEKRVSTEAIRDIPITKKKSMLTSKVLALFLGDDLE